MSAGCHEVNNLGAERHYFVMEDGFWVCECGETHGSHGEPLSA